jgi:hypothetical protein
MGALRPVKKQESRRVLESNLILTTNSTVFFLEPPRSRGRSYPGLAGPGAAKPAAEPLEQIKATEAAHRPGMIMQVD